jgi:hypothetical protein
MGLRGARRALLMNVLGGAGAAIEWLLRVEFATDDDAPITSPYAGEVGELTVTDSAGVWSVASGTLVPSKNMTGARDPQIIAPFTRSVGLGMTVRLRRIDAFSGAGVGSYIGFSTVEAVFGISQLAGVRYPSLTAITLGMANVTAVASVAANVYNTYWIIMRGTGYFLYADGKLIWVHSSDTTAQLYARVSAYGAGTAPEEVDFVRVRQLPAPFNDDYGPATLHVVAPVADTEYTGTADAITDLTVTAPGSLDGLNTTRCGFYYRADADLSPAWDCYVDGQGRGRLDSIAADTTRTNRMNSNSVIVGGETVTLRSIHAAALHNMYTLAGTAWTKHGAQVNLSLNDTVTTIEPHVPAGWTAANLDDWPYTPDAATQAILDAT